ncbi:MAG TPA: glycoside hydrolase/phage tail family protein [Bauldia sp.]|nr:glycoside hydrolase/phage tail family protein [Bauldia sp.]
MATLVLQAAGAAIGSLFGPLGTIVGRAVGGLAGYAIDQSLFGEHRTIEGPRLADLTVQTSREGAPIPRLYGRVRISGQVIWATRFEETVSDVGEGGKGGGSGTTLRTYAYFANFAVGLCEGPIARIGRVWADGKPFDLSTVTCRIYRGDAAQDVDSLIEAKQGDAPAYRDTAMIVFERLPLENFGNRIPQLSFEVIRPVDGIETAVRAVSMIPGSTEFGYDPEPVTSTITPGSSTTVNRHVDGVRTDWQASVDELQAVCANAGRVGLVTAWFGNDLRAGECTLKPAVVDRTTVTSPYTWSAAGMTRDTARLVSTFESKAAFGGTPADASLVRAIRDLNERDIKVTFYPFIMMDVPPGNGRDDPYGGAEQAAYPWRGSMTLSVAPGLPGSPDKTTAAADEVAAFVGTAAVDDFHLSGDSVVYTGPDEWSFRRFILHYAWLCKAAGGVDAFLIGSELRGLSTVRSAASTYPFVTALVALADDVKGILGGATTVTYGADWSEYFGHHPDDGSGDVFFHLDPLWASAAVGCVGIDNYMPLSDWRDGSEHLDAADWDNGRDAAYLRSNIAAGEGYDWYYASDADRAVQVRTPITDGGGGKPWVFRYKDLVGWWSNRHFNRPGGVESGTHTAWVPQSKPIWFTEAGCPAIDKGPNQPNVFYDAKSSASALPYFSNGLRDDLVQRRYIAATLAYWNPDAPDFDDAANPESSAYAGRMVDHAAIHLWTWDARPYPAFPLYTDVWSDGGNWDRGHWLTGRLGALTAESLAAAILADYGITDADIGDLDGVVDGFLIGEVTSARGALEPLAQLLAFEGHESGDRFAVTRRGRAPKLDFTGADLVEDKDKPVISIRRAQETELPAEIGIGFSDPLADYRPTSVSSRRLVGGSRRSVSTDTGAVLSHAVAGGLADTMLQDLWAGRESIALALPQRTLALEPADVCTLDIDGDVRTILVTRIEDAGLRRIEARTIEPDILAPVPAASRVVAPPVAVSASRPEVVLLDLPLLTGSEPGYAPRVAVFAAPWPGAIALSVGTADTGYVPRQAIERRAVMGELTSELAPGPVARWDRAASVTVRLYGGALAGAPELSVLNGANVAAIGSSETGYEVVQFSAATLIDTRTWRLEGLLRGQAGTGDIAAAGHDAGARFVLLDRAVVPLSLSEAEAGLGLTLRCGAAGAPYDPDVFADVTITAARRGLRCLAPVHARAHRDEGTGDVTLSWIRQTRIGGDAWEPVEVPLGETSEAYSVAIGDGMTTFRTVTAASPSLLYPAADQLADFGALPDEITIAISQISPTEGPGSGAFFALNV